MVEDQIDACIPDTGYRKRGAMHRMKHVEMTRVAPYELPNAEVTSPCSESKKRAAPLRDNDF